MSFGCRCSDGVWDPEKWHASLYPTSERSSPVEGFKKDYAEDRIPLKRRITGKSCCFQISSYSLDEIFVDCVALCFWAWFISAVYNQALLFQILASG